MAGGGIGFSALHLANRSISPADPFYLSQLVGSHVPQALSAPTVTHVGVLQPHYLFVLIEIWQTSDYSQCLPGTATSSSQTTSSAASVSTGTPSAIGPLGGVNTVRSHCSLKSIGPSYHFYRRATTFLSPRMVLSLGRA